MIGVLRRPKSRSKRKNGRKRTASATKPKATPRTKSNTKRRDGWKAHGPDALGLAVLFVAILMVLSLTGSAGPVGHWLGWVLLGGFGRVAYLVPLATLVVSLAAFVRRDETARILVGTLLLTAAGSGLLHLWQGAPALGDGYEGLAAAGGALGAVVGVPLEAYIGVWAGALACTFVGILGALIVTKTPLRRAVQGVLLWCWAAVRWILDRRRSAGETPVPVPTPAPRATVQPDPEPTGEEETGELPLVVPAPDPAPEPKPAVPPANGMQGRLDLELPEAAAGAYRAPPLAIFRRSGAGGRSGRGAEEVAQVLERTLRDFGVDANVTAITRGPTVTRFEVELGSGVKVSQVTRLADDIAYALGSADVRLIAPIPGKSAIGVEVPNRDRELVLVGDIVHSAGWKQHRHPLVCALGKDISGEPVMINLAEMPHLLIAGATGAGKSSCLNTLISSLLARSTPDVVRMVMIDPKMVELSHFADIPHLLSPVVTHPKRAAETLSWVVREMERRYELLSGVGQRNIDFYNDAVRAGGLPGGPDGQEREALSYIAVFVDELADLMLVAARQVEDSICRIAQMARAVGIHLVVATQRPSVDVVTGLIKANIPSRIALSVASQVDSRTILDMGGADKLVGHGDMLYLPAGTSKPRRIQGAYITEKELSELTDHIRAQARPDYEEEALEAATAQDAEGEGSDDDSDPLLDQAMELVVRSQMGSTSMLQRKLRVGFARAGRLMDLLERRGVVGPQEGSKARAVLIALEDLHPTEEPVG